MKLILKILLNLLAIIFSPTVYGQIRDTTFQEYLIYTSKINFQFGDSTYPYSLFVEPNGLFYFEEGFVVGEPKNKIIMSNKKNHHPSTIYKEVFTPKIDSILTVESLYPKFITHDKSFINEYSFDYQLRPLIYEFTYSFLLHNLEEPSIYNARNKRAIRIIMPAEGTKHPGRYSIYRFEFENSMLTFKEGEFDTSGTFRILNSNTYMVSDKNRSMVDKAINKINFEMENYFLKANSDSKFFIEYRVEEDYYAILRPIDKGDYIKIYLALHDLQVKGGKSNSR